MTVADKNNPREILGPAGHWERQGVTVADPGEVAAIEQEAGLRHYHAGRPSGSKPSARPGLGEGGEEMPYEETGPRCQEDAASVGVGQVELVHDRGGASAAAGQHLGAREHRRLDTHRPSACLHR